MQIQRPVLKRSALVVREGERVGIQYLGEEVSLQGLAARLIRAVEDEARARHLPGVRLGVRIALTANQQRFTSLGYRETSREAHPGFDHFTSINMRKPLN